MDNKKIIIGAIITLAILVLISLNTTNKPEKNLHNEVAKLVLPEGYEVLECDRVLPDPYFIPNRLLETTNNIDCQREKVLWPPILLDDDLFAPINECNDEGELISFGEGMDACRSIKSEQDIGGKEYHVFRYGFNNKKTLLFGILNKRCDFYPEGECPHTYYNLEETTKTLDELVYSLTK